MIRFVRVLALLDWQYLIGAQSRARQRDPDRPPYLSAAVPAPYSIPKPALLLGTASLLISARSLFGDGNRDRKLLKTFKFALRRVV
jgi:hypothetical protein